MTTMTTADILARMAATGTTYADAAHAEALHVIAHADLKVALINSLIGSDNPETNKPHSATSAEKAASASDEYRASQVKGATLMFAKLLAEVQWQMAKALARTIGTGAT